MLGGSRKNELNVFEMCWEKMRAAVKNIETTEGGDPTERTVEEIIKLAEIESAGLRRAAQKLQSSYTGRPYKEMDSDLRSIMVFRTKGKHNLSESKEKILRTLGLMGKSSESAARKPESTSVDNLVRRVQTTVTEPENTPVRRIQRTAAPSEITPKEKQPVKLATMEGDNFQVASPEGSSLTPLAVETSEVPRLKHDLSRVLFNPGVYQLQDPRSRVWNFDPYLGTLMPVSEFNYDALNTYTTSSQDAKLREIALENSKKYIGSTSSLSSVLSHFHFLLSAFRELNLEQLTRGFKDDGEKFTKIHRGPAAIFLRYKDGIYAVDADKEFDSANILMSLGRSMEKLLTSDKEEFEQYRKTGDGTGDNSALKSTTPEAYHYSGLGQFLIRSQLDARDPRLPGSGVFDLKTRAVAAVRMMVRDHEKGVGYQIRKRFGTWESYEREYYDMMRSAFLKYSLQVRMGRMDGIFVAYHNTERLFGFQYVPLSEMDVALHGQEHSVLGDREFSLSIQVLNYIFDEATAKYPGQSLRFHFEAREPTSASSQYMYVFAEPVTEEEIVAIQTSKAEEIRAFEDRIFNLTPRTAPDSSGDADGDIELVSENNETEASGRGAIEQDSNAANVELLDSILGMNIHEAMSPRPEEENKASEDDSKSETVAQDSPSATNPTTNAGGNKPLSGWKLNIRNKVNGMPVVRPEKLMPGDSWTLQYALKPLTSADAQRHYTLCKRRRKATLEAPQDADEAANFYLRKLISMSREGAKWRQNQDRKDALREQIVLYGKGEA